MLSTSSVVYPVGSTPTDVNIRSSKPELKSIRSFTQNKLQWRWKTRRDNGWRWKTIWKTSFMNAAF
ncbi:hypothetical protein BCR33DRAFT_721042, partial [Rhizoclosmatium globosum]